MARQTRSARPEGSDAESGAAVASDLESIGIHTDEMAEAVQGRVSEFQELLEDEIRERPLRALGWAAVAGFVLGVMAARS
jgi:ElaB/YqjD/DUF883 family membrane-anchored ribosome-binding protein